MTHLAYGGKQYAVPLLTHEDGGVLFTSVVGQQGEDNNNKQIGGGGAAAVPVLIHPGMEEGRGFSTTAPMVVRSLNSTWDQREFEHGQHVPLVVGRVLFLSSTYSSHLLSSPPLLSSLLPFSSPLPPLSLFFSPSLLPPLFSSPSLSSFSLLCFSCSTRMRRGEGSEMRDKGVKKRQSGKRR